LYRRIKISPGNRKKLKPSLELASQTKAKIGKVEPAEHIKGWE